MGLLILAGMSAAGTIVAIVLNRKSGADRLESEERRHTERLAGDERMHEARLESEAEVHTERLAHERREAVRTTAATAYVDAKQFLGVMQSAAVHGRIPEDAEAWQERVESTYRDVALVTALGWSEEVRTAAAELGAALTSSTGRAYELIEAMSLSHGVPEAGKQWLAGEEEAWAAIEVYRKEITK